MGLPPEELGHTLKNMGFPLKNFVKIKASPPKNSIFCYSTPKKNLIFYNLPLENSMVPQPEEGGGGVRLLKEIAQFIFTSIS